MAQELESYLNQALKRLEKASEEVLKTQGFTKESETLQLLTELVREQVTNEDTRSTAGKTR